MLAGVLGENGVVLVAESEVYAFLDKLPAQRTTFTEIVVTGELNHTLHVTDMHLVFVQRICLDGSLCSVAVPAKDVKVGDLVYVHNSGLQSEMGVGMVLDTRLFYSVGAFAPATRTGTLLVDGVLASNYAMVGTDTCHETAHIAFAPLRSLTSVVGHLWEEEEGVHWYAALLQSLHNILSFAAVV